ncbi:TTF-type domain-containing protein [Citrus sinensis]|nr:TTF-type domain-containing protein [Citrus sinensis]
MNQKQHIATFFERQSEKTQSEYETRLNVVVDCIRFLLNQGLAFRGHDESDGSNNRGNFLELLHFLADHNEDINAVTFKNTPLNLQMTSPKIQKDIVSCVATETTNAIIREMGDALFSVLIDESRDISTKEQMAVVLCYVDKNGYVVECFVGIERVSSTTAASLKESLDNMFSRFGLSLSMLRGQGYDGASNMHGEFNGLKTLILEENESAYYVHYFAHQLQLALISVAKKHEEVNSLFNLVSMLVNVVGVSAKRRDILHEKHALAVIEALSKGELSSGQGLNQEITLKRPADTCWSSHYGTLMSIISMFPSVVDVLEIIEVEGNSEQRFQDNTLLKLMQSFDFVFCLFLMKNILGYANKLSRALQRKDQDILNAVKLVEVYKHNLQKLRDSGWYSLFGQVSTFCSKHDIDITNLHRYRVELFYVVLDMQLQELNNRFNESNTELLICLACLCPNDLFAAFDKEKLPRLAEFYPKDFSAIDLIALEMQLDVYITDLQSSAEFSELKGIGELARTMVKIKKDKVYPLVYQLVTLALILPVATATVERVFSAMNFVKNRLRNRMGDQWLNDNLGGVCFFV